MNFRDDLEDINLSRRYSISGVGTFQLAQKFDLQLNALGQLQGPNSVYTVGGLGKFHVNQQRGKETEVHLGVGYRTTGTIWPILAVQYQNFYISGSYDIDISDFGEFVTGVNGHNPSTFELHFTYIITNVKPFKNCLLYTSPSPRDRQKSRMPSSA